MRFILTITFTKTAAEQIKSGVRRISTISVILSDCIIVGTIAAPITVMIKPKTQSVATVINLVVTEDVLYFLLYGIKETCFSKFVLKTT